MNKRYIDFVPTNGTKTGGSRRGGTVHVQMPDARSTSKRTVSRVSTERRVMRTAPVRATTSVSRARVSSRSQSSGATVKKSDASTVVTAPALGVVEDLNNKFVKTDVPKRPLSSGQKAHTGKAGGAKSELETAKSRRIIGRGSKSAEAGAVGAKSGEKDKSKFRMPKSPFINQEKVVKRPLSKHSKNVYQKKAVTPKETPANPVAIIKKPEKESHVGVVITVIVTIILGAAAGTVAFLLLPK